MTEVQLLEQLRDLAKLLIESPGEYFIAQSTKDSIRINTGSRIVNFPKSIINFSGRYVLISKFGLEEAMKVINEIARFMQLHYVAVLPRKYGYKAFVYEDRKVIHTYKIKFIWSRSTILCYTMLFYRLIKSK